MKLEYGSKRVEQQCNSVKAATKLFGGDKALVNKLHARITSLRAAETLRDIVIQPHFRFHSLNNKNGRNLEGYFAIAVKTPKEPWRIILQPLDENGNTFNPCNIDEISGIVRIVEIREVSKHYE